MGYFKDTTVEITFKGVKQRVSKDVADAIKSKEKPKPKPKAKK